MLILAIVLLDYIADPSVQLPTKQSDDQAPEFTIELTDDTLSKKPASEEQEKYIQLHESKYIYRCLLWIPHVYIIIIDR